MDDLHRDVARWSTQLPQDIDLVVGIPRSGLLAATVLALHRQLPLTDLDGLLAGRLLGGGRRLSETDTASSIPEARRILVVDDSVYTGSAIAKARAAIAGSPLADRVEFGVVYATSGSTSYVDHYFDITPQPRVFAWNVLNHDCLVESCVDIDGVLCRDPSPEENDDGARYEEFLTETPVIWRPRMKVGYLVTNRLERYRPQTELWLERAGIGYGELVMHPAESGAARLVAGNHGRRKGEFYRSTNAPLFIESDLHQSIEISTLAGKPVYCTDVSAMVYPGSTADRFASPTWGRGLMWRARHEARLKAKAVRRRLT
jgi:orotate phosphoribosyltransferase